MGFTRIFADSIVCRYNNPAFGFESAIRKTDEDSQEGKWKRNLIKIAGYVPILGGIPIGIVYYQQGKKMQAKIGATPEEKAMGTRFKARGVMIFFGLGPLVFIIDLVRSIFDHAILPFIKWYIHFLLSVAREGGSKAVVEHFPLANRVVRLLDSCFG